VNLCGHENTRRVLSAKVNAAMAEEGAEHGVNDGEMDAV